MLSHSYILFYKSTLLLLQSLTSFITLLLYCCALIFYLLNLRLFNCVLIFYFLSLRLRNFDSFYY